MIHPFSDAARSLLFDDALLHAGLNCFSLRINDPCVSIGFNQDADVEVNLELASQLDIPVIRRKTGGGAVYRDRGCVAYSFVLPVDCRNLAVQLVQESLGQMGVQVERAGRNDLFWQGRKVSGYAWTEHQGMVLVHGSLLFSTDIDLMARLLDCGKLKYRGTGIASVHSRVTNLNQALPSIDAEEFMDVLGTTLTSQLESSGSRVTSASIQDVE